MNSYFVSKLIISIFLWRLPDSAAFPSRFTDNGPLRWYHQYWWIFPSLNRILPHPVSNWSQTHWRWHLNQWDFFFLHQRDLSNVCISHETKLHNFFVQFSSFCVCDMCISNTAKYSHVTHIWSFDTPFLVGFHFLQNRCGQPAYILQLLCPLPITFLPT